MKFEFHNTKTTHYLQIDPFASEGDEKFRSRITVSQGVSIRDFTWEQASVNWSAIGNTEPAETRQFAEAMKYAAAIADKWNQERAGTVADPYRQHPAERGEGER